ncbi:MAG: respiratory nitrate reductase subunit gamma [Syntrophaceae bacterium]|nr:respiratory nitrate reductase subunit gamma [Syntrophaceae bacterium]
MVYLTYFCAAIFILAVGGRIYRQMKLPIHVRWELYPVKHEAGEKARYGGSYMEEPNWWEREKKSSLLNEIRYMVPEILFLRGLKKENPRLWNLSFPFHFGLYLILGTLGLLALGAIFMILGFSISPGRGFWGSLIYYLTILLGFLGLTLGTAGTAALFRRRLRDPDLRNYSAFSDYLNLAFIFLFFHISLLAWLFHDHTFDGARAYIYSLLTFGEVPAGVTGKRTLLGSLSVVFSSLLIAYIPLTHMSHMFMKYFLYHAVKWEDRPNVTGSRIEAAVLENLGYKPTWAAPHIGADGTKSWAEIATSTPKEKK